MGLALITEFTRACRSARNIAGSSTALPTSDLERSPRMQSLTRQCRVLGLASGSDDALSLLSAGRFLPLLLGIDGVEHEVIEAVAAPRAGLFLRGSSGVMFCFAAGRLIHFIVIVVLHDVLHDHRDAAVRRVERRIWFAETLVGEPANLSDLI